MNIGTDLLRTFVAVAETLNFTRAAVMVHKTQSAVSQQIKRLESDLGASLFDRNGPGVSLTDSGHAFLPHARQVLKAHDAAVAAIVEPELSGLLRVGFPDELASCFLPEILCKFAKCYPRVQVTVSCETSDNLARAVAEGELDVYYNTCVHPIPGSRIFARTRLVWATSAQHLAHQESPVPLALFHEGCSYRQYATQTLVEAGVPFRVAYSSPSLAGLQGAVTSGMAVTVVIPQAKPEGTMVIGEAQGFPALPMANAFVVRTPENNPVIDCFADIAEEVILNSPDMIPVADSIPATSPTRSASPLSGHRG